MIVRFLVHLKVAPEMVLENRERPRAPKSQNCFGKQGNSKGTKQPKWFWKTAKQQGHQTAKKIWKTGEQ